VIGFTAEDGGGEKFVAVKDVAGEDLSKVGRSVLRPYNGMERPTRTRMQCSGGKEIVRGFDKRKRRERIDELGDLRLMRIPNNPRHSRKPAQFLRSPLRIAPRGNDADVRIRRIKLSNRIARLSISSSRHGTSIHDHDIRCRRCRSAPASAFEQLPFEGRPIGMCRAAPKLFNVKGRHSIRHGETPIRSPTRISALQHVEKSKNSEKRPQPGLCFTRPRLCRYNLSTSMAHQRYSPTALDNPKVSIVIPVYNEKSTIDEILRRVLDTGIRMEVIIVDDCSTDGTRQILENMAARQANGETAAPAQDGGDLIALEDLRFFFQAPNQGKGAALRRGFAQATGEIVLVQDADLEYDPRDYPVLLGPIIDGRADVVYGSRFLGGPQRVHYFWHYVANRMLTLLSDIFTNLKLTDMETCYKVFRREVLKGIEIKSNRFGFEPEITAKIAKHNWRIYEVPITYAGRTYEEGKKITWKDGLQALWCIIRYKLGD